MAHHPLMAHWTKSGQTSDMDKLWTQFGFHLLLPQSHRLPMINWTHSGQILDMGKVQTNIGFGQTSDKVRISILVALSPPAAHGHLDFGQSLDFVTSSYKQ